MQEARPLGLVQPLTLLGTVIPLETSLASVPPSVTVRDRSRF